MSSLQIYMDTFAFRGTTEDRSASENKGTKDKKGRHFISLFFPFLPLRKDDDGAAKRGVKVSQAARIREACVSYSRLVVCAYPDR